MFKKVSILYVLPDTCIKITREAVLSMIEMVALKWNNTSTLTMQNSPRAVNERGNAAGGRKTRFSGGVASEAALSAHR